MVRFDFLIFLLIFSVYTLLSNIVPNFLRFPWDIDLGKLGINFYFPLISSLIISAGIIISRRLLGF